MRILIFTSLMFFFSIFLECQNIIPNPSFEEYDRLPTSLLDNGREFESAIKNWSTPNKASTDLISPRMKSSNLSKVQARTGKNVAGILINGDFWAEYVGVKLKTPILPGETYYIEFWISMPERYGKTDSSPTYLNDNFGIVFGDYYYADNTKILTNPPQVNADANIYVEPGKWTKVFGIFEAKIPARYMYLGQFLPKNGPQDLAIGYFLLDDVLIEKHKDQSSVYVPGKSYKIEGSIASIDLSNILFETDKYELLPESFTELNKLANILKTDPSLTIEIQGHTDDEGDQIYNQSLSENRSQAVFEYLVNKGIDQKRLSSKGFGKAKPIANNQTKKGRQLNRRVELLVNNNNKFTGTPQHELNADETYLFSNQITQNEKTQLSFIGKYSKHWNCNNTTTNTITDINTIGKMAEYKPMNARKFILSQSKSKRAVFVNESKTNPQHRAFMISLLEKLYEQGYHYLGIEALNYTDKELKTRGYPTLASGYYTDEPLMGELIRTALQLGFSVFPYDVTPEQQIKAMNILQSKDGFRNLEENVLRGAANEWAQAMNIMRILKKNPEAKILVFGSQNHIFEQQISGIRFMAQWFRDFSKIDPLTIDQVMMSEKCPQEEESLYKAKNVNSPTVFIKNKKVFVTSIEDQYGEQQKICDIQVFLPKSMYKNNRPNWLDLDGLRKAHFVNPDKHGLSYPCMVTAIKEGEDLDTAVPIDVIEIMDNNDQTALMLPPGEYALILRDHTQNKILEMTIE